MILTHPETELEGCPKEQSCWYIHKDHPCYWSDVFDMNRYPDWWLFPVIIITTPYIVNCTVWNVISPTMTHSFSHPSCDVVGVISFLTKKSRLRGVRRLALGHIVDQASKGESTLLPLTLYDESVFAMLQCLIAFLIWGGWGYKSWKRVHRRMVARVAWSFNPVNHHHQNTQSN